MTDSLRFANKAVLITGSSGGLGAEMARAFAKVGARVVVTGRDKRRVHDVAQECNELSPNDMTALEVVADLTDDDDCRRLVDTTVRVIGKIDVLVNNAGAGSYSTLDSPDLMKNLDHMYRLDMRTVVLMSQLAAPYLQQTRGVIINNSSICGIRPYAGCSAYCMAKAAVDMFTKCAALELGPKGVRVNAINPTAVRTGFQANSSDANVFNNFVDHLENNSPLPGGGLPKPEDIAKVVLFLASDNADYITGVVLPVDCGTVLM